MGYTFASTWGSNNGPSSFNVQGADATGNGDLGGAVPTYNVGGTAFLYLDLLASTSVTFAQTPAITITSTAAYPAGTACGLAVYSNNGGPTAVWHQSGVTAPRPSGSTLTLAAQTLGGGSTVSLAAAHQYLAFYCQ